MTIGSFKLQPGLRGSTLISSSPQLEVESAPFPTAPQVVHKLPSAALCAVGPGRESLSSGSHCFNWRSRFCHAWNQPGWPPGFGWLWVWVSCWRTQVRHSCLGASGQPLPATIHHVAGPGGAPCLEEGTGLFWLLPPLSWSPGFPAALHSGANSVAQPPPGAQAAAAWVEESSLLQAGSPQRGLPRGRAAIEHG